MRDNGDLPRRRVRQQIRPGRPGPRLQLAARLAARDHVVHRVGGERGEFLGIAPGCPPSSPLEDADVELAPAHVVGDVQPVNASDGCGGLRGAGQVAGMHGVQAVVGQGRVSSMASSMNSA